MPTTKTRTSMRFTFNTAVPLEEAKSTLSLAGLAVESLYGRERVELEAPVAIDGQTRQFVFDTSHRVGQTLALVFAGFVRREFGSEAVRVEHGDGWPQARVSAA